MLPGTASLPIAIEPAVADLMQGVLAIEGLLRYEAPTLVLEYRMQHRQEKMAWSKVMQVVLGLEDLEDVVFRKSLFGGTVQVRMKRLGVLEGLPGDHREVLKLKIKRSYRSEAAALVSRIQLALSEYRLDRL